MKYISLNWTLALKFSIGKKKKMHDCRILMAHDCIYGEEMDVYCILYNVYCVQCNAYYIRQNNYVHCILHSV